MRKLSYFLLVGFVAMLAAPAEAVIEADDGPKKIPVGPCTGEDGERCVTDLIAGQHMIVGTVEVIEGVDSLVVVYEITDLNWSITQIHLEVSENSITEWAPGQYTYTYEDLNTQYMEIPIPYDAGDCLYYAAHAVVNEVVEFEISLPDFELNLPDQVTMKVKYPSAGDPSYFMTTVSGGSVLDGIYDGWCVDIGRTIGNNTDFPAYVYSSYEDLPPGTVDRPENLDLVNWILNQEYVGQPSPGCGGNYTFGDVQRAVWELIDNTQSTSGLGDWDDCRATEISDAALASGEGFVPGCFDVIAVILVPKNLVTQVTIAQVTSIEVPTACTPILGGGSETAWGCGYKIREKKNWGWYFHCCD